jgi:hypothetical protein
MARSNTPEAVLSNLAADVTDRHRPPSPAAFARLERRIGAPVPRDYRRLLGVINGGAVHGEWVNKHVMLSELYGLRSDEERYNLLDQIGFTWTTNANYEEPGLAHLPTDTIPIASDIGDNWVCLVIKGKQAGAVYYWDHEASGGYSASTTIRDAKEMQRLAPNLPAFLRGLKREGPPRLEELERALSEDDAAGLERLLSGSAPERLARSLASGHTLLEEACARGGVRTVRALLVREVPAQYAVWAAIRGRWPRTLRILLEHGMKPRAMDVGECVHRGHLPTLRVLLEHMELVSRGDLKAAQKRLEAWDPAKAARIKAVLVKALRS